MGSKITRVAGVRACHGVVPAHVHQLVEGFPVFSADEGSSEASPTSDFKFQSLPIRGNSFAHTLSLHASDVDDMRVYKVLFCEGFVEQVLDGSVQVASVVWSALYFLRIRLARTRENYAT